MGTTQALEAFVDTDEAARFLGKPRSWLHQRGGPMGVPRYKIGNVWRYRLSELDGWVRQQR